MRGALLVLVLVAACGRVDFDPAALVGTDAAGDASITPLTPDHRYGFAGDMHDDFGGPDLAFTSGAGIYQTPAAGLRFAACQGFHAADVVPASNVYTIDIALAFDDVTGWRKLVDYRQQAADEGLYVYEQALQFVIVPEVTFATSPTADFAPGVAHRVTLTRDAANRVVGYIDGAPKIAFTDDTGVATFSAARDVDFFDDDTATTGECSAGVVTRIELFDDRALDASQVAQL